MLPTILFSPFSVGEVGRLGSPGRREVGHGKLAERAILEIIPKAEDFPYSIRIESISLNLMAPLRRRQFVVERLLY